jgi:hypothetical protein
MWEKTASRPGLQRPSEISCLGFVQQIEYFFFLTFYGRRIIPTPKKKNQLAIRIKKSSNQYPRVLVCGALNLRRPSCLWKSFETPSSIPPPFTWLLIFTKDPRSLISGFIVFANRPSDILHDVDL